ncbi:MAG: metallophosphoesterase family protein [Planctomycetes bacterium]|nr:metallophosphoesterase family protein [Planctomycetota bacterium]
MRHWLGRLLDRTEGFESVGFCTNEQDLASESLRLKPQLILLTGDYMNVREGAAALSEVLHALKADYGVYGVEGNWDTKFLTADLFKRADATLLVDDTHVLERNGRRLRLVGQAMTPGRPLKELLPPKDDGAATIFLHHLPDAVDELKARDPGQRVDLFLCGHTHGGQVCLPFWGAVITLSKYHKKYERGRYDADGVPMIVSRGVGSGGGGIPHVRFLARPEVGVIDLVYK